MPGLSRKQITKLNKLYQPKLTKYITHQPTAKQQAFLLLNQLEVFYGGAAGGGKSDALLMAALQYVDVPGYAAFLFRKSYTDLSLPEALMDRANSWLRGTDAKWNGTDKTWLFPSTARLTFGYIEHETDKYRYKSAAGQFMGFDELTQFSETQHTFMFSRLRRLEGFNVPLRVRSASNPGDKGHEWVKNRFGLYKIDPTLTDSPFAYATDLWRYQHPDRLFIPATLKDNPFLDQAAYEKSLAELDPFTRAQLLAGDWSVRPSGRMFRRFWFEIVDAAPKELSRVRYWDLASTEPTKPGQDPDYTAGVLMGKDKDGIYYIVDVRRFRLTPRDVERNIKQTAIMDGESCSIWMEQEPGSSGVNTIDYYHRIVLPRFRFTGNKTTGSKPDRAAPFASMAEAGNIKIVRGPWNAEFLDEIDIFPNDDVHDDQVDAASGCYEQLAKLDYMKPTGSLVAVTVGTSDYSGESSY